MGRAHPASWATLSKSSQSILCMEPARQTALSVMSPLGAVVVRGPARWAISSVAATSTIEDDSMCTLFNRTSYVLT